MSIQKGAALAAGFATLAVGFALPMYAANKQSPMAAACDKAAAVRAEARQMASEGRLLRAEGRLDRASTLCAREQTGLWVDRAELLSQVGHCKDASGVASLARAERDLEGADRARLDAARARCDEHERPRTDEDRAAAAKARTGARAAELEGRFDEAATLWGEAWDRSHTDPEDLVGQGRCADWAGHRVEAERAYQRALAASWRAAHGVPTSTPVEPSYDASLAVTAGHLFVATSRSVDAVALSSARVTPLAGEGSTRVLAQDGSAWVERTDGGLRYVDVRGGPSPWTGPPNPELFAVAGGHVAYAEGDRVHVVDGASGRELSVSPGAPRALELSADGKTLLVQDDQHVTVRDATDGTKRFEAASDGVSSLSADGALVVYRTPPEVQPEGEAIFELRVAAVQGGARVHTVRGHFRSVGRLALSQGGRYLATTSTTSTRVRDLVSDKEIWRNEGGTQGLAWSVDGRALAVASFDGIHVLDPASGAVKDDPRGHAVEAFSAALSRDGTRLAAIVGDHVRVLALPSLAPLSTFEAAHGTFGERIALSPDGRRVVVTAADVPPRVHDAATGARVSEVHAPDAAEWREVRASFAEDGSLVVAVTKGDDDALVVHHVDPETGAIRSTTTPQGATGGIAALSKDGRIAVVGGEPLRVVALDGARPPFEIAGSVDALHPSATSTRVWTGDEHVLRLFDVAANAKLAEGTMMEKGWVVADAAGSLRMKEWPPLDGELFTTGDFDEGGGLVAHVTEGRVVLLRRGVEDELRIAFSSLGGLTAKSKSGLVFRTGAGAVPYRCHLVGEQTIAWEACADALALPDPATVLPAPAPVLRR